MKVCFENSEFAAVILFFAGAFSSAQIDQRTKPSLSHSQKPARTSTKPKHSSKSVTSSNAKRPRVIQDLSGFDLLDPGGLHKETMVSGATRGGERPFPLAPHLARLYGKHPTFRWAYDQPVPIYKFVLRDDADREVYHANVIRMEFKYPEDAPSLNPEKTYFWTVEALQAELGSEPSRPSGLLVLSESQHAEIQSLLAPVINDDSLEAGLAQARIFTNKRLWYDAVTAYSDLIQKYPDRPETYVERAMIFAQLEVTQSRAEQDFLKADQLQLKH